MRRFDWIAGREHGRRDGQYPVLSTQYLGLGRKYSPRHTSWATILVILCGFCPSVLSEQPSGTPPNRLPWESSPRVDEPIVRPPAGAAEVLERFDIGASQLESFTNGQPLSPGEDDVLLKILYRYPRLGLDNLLRWRKRNVGWDQLAAAPANHRSEVFHVAGRVTRTEKQTLLPEQAELYEFDHYYRVTLKLDNSPYEAVIAARRIPAVWPLGAPIDQPAATDAIFLKVGDSTGNTPQFHFAAGRIGWYPDRPDESHHIGQPQLALAHLGMDIGLWDDIAASKDHALTAADREPFYQLLAAVGRPEARQLHAVTQQSLNNVPLLEKSSEHFGDCLPVEGIARRITKIAVNDADIRSRFGIDHYYEIDLFLPLNNASIRFGKDASGEKNPVFRNTFPATLIVRELPPELAEGENIHERVRADGVFFKVWTYRSNYTTRFGQLQPSPLFIAAQPQLVRIETAASWITGGLVTLAFALALGVAGIIVWWYDRSDRKSRARIAAAKRETLDFTF
jgi:hypothetical protein